MAYDNTNTGIMYRNDRKESDKHPDFTGTINIDGTDYWLSGWVKEGRDGTKMAGKKFFSLAFKPKEDSAPRRTSNPPPPDVDDDIPFAPIGKWL
jgi:hypothetical protein